MRFDALPGWVMEGSVQQVDPQGENWQGDVVYCTIVTLREQNPDLSWNMTVSTESVP